MKTCIVTLLLGSMLHILAAQHATVNDSPNGLTLAQCIESAMSKNQLLAASQFKLDAAEANMREAQGKRLPRLTLSGRAAQLSDVPTYSLTLPGIGRQTLFESISHSYSTRVTLQQPIFTGFRLAGLAEMSEHQHEISSYEYRKTKNELVMDVSTSYWNLYKAAKLQELLEETRKQLSEHLVDVKNLLGQGMATQLDVLRVETQLMDLSMKNIEANSAVLLASMRLSSLIGSDLLVPLKPTDDATKMLPSDRDLSVELNSLMASARDRRPEMLVIKEMRAIREAAVSVAKAGWYPQVSISASYEYARPNNRIIPPSDRWEKTWDMGIVLQWSLWDWFETSHKVAEASARESEARAQFKLLSDAVALDVVTQQRRLVEAHTLVSAGEQHVRSAAEASRVANEKFRQGVATSTDVLDAEQALLQARVNHTVATVESALQLQRFKMALGEDLFD